MLKKISLIILCVGLAIVLTSVAATLICMQNPSQEDLTFVHVLSTAYNSAFIVMLVVGVGLIIPSAFCLVFKNTVTKHCTVLTTLISLCLSAMGALGLTCGFELMVFAAFGEQSSHPVAYAASTCGAMIALFAFIILCALYFRFRAKKRSATGTVIDVVTSIIYLPIAIVLILYLLGVFF